MSELIQSLLNFLTGTGIWKVLFCPTGEGQGLFDLAESGWAFNPTAWQLLVMYVIVGILVYLAIVKKFEPLLLLPIAIGMMLTNLPARTCSIWTTSSPTTSISASSSTTAASLTSSIWVSS